MAKQTDKIPESIRRCFDIEEHGKMREFWCKHCSKGWALPTDNKHPGNILRLLNHARMHEQKNA